MSVSEIFRSLLAEGTARDYHFGSETMVGIGGWPYKSVALYVTYCGVGAALCAVGCACLIAANRKPRFAPVGYSAIAAFIAMTALTGSWG